MTDEEPSQDFLLSLRASLTSGRLKAPKEPPSPALAQRLHDFREAINADVDVLSTLPHRISLLVSPRDGSPLFLIAIDAMASTGPTGPAQ